VAVRVACLGMNLAKTARNAAIADVAFAFARDRLAAQLPGVKPRKRRGPGKKALVFGGVAAATAAAALLKRDKVAALLPGRSDEPAPPAPETYTPPPVSNYDAAGPVANTATTVPVPPAYESPTIDEAEEEAAAAAEAANIGGQVSDYAGPDGEYADDAYAPLAESGEGDAEGQEQTELELRDAAEGNEDDGLSPEEAQINEVLEETANPLGGEEVEPGKPADDSEWRTWSGRSADS
jgi:hypothetical protein